jgi:hypothetical protein
MKFLPRPPILGNLIALSAPILISLSTDERCTPSIAAVSFTEYIFSFSWVTFHLPLVEVPRPFRNREKPIRTNKHRWSFNAAGNPCPLGQEPVLLYRNACPNAVRRRTIPAL